MACLWHSYFERVANVSTILGFFITGFELFSFRILTMIPWRLTKEFGNDWDMNRSLLSFGTDVVRFVSGNFLQTRAWKVERGKGRDTNARTSIRWHKMRFLLDSFVMYRQLPCIEIPVLFVNLALSSFCTLLSSLAFYSFISAIASSFAGS